MENIKKETPPSFPYLTDIFNSLNNNIVTLKGFAEVIINNHYKNGKVKEKTINEAIFFYKELEKNQIEINKCLADLEFFIHSKTDPKTTFCLGSTKVLFGEKMTNQEKLVEIAKNDKNSDVRCGAVRRITDQVLLAEIAKSNDDYDTLSEAKGRLLFLATEDEFINKYYK